jgi:hypothetical protein
MIYRIDVVDVSFRLLLASLSGLLTACYNRNLRHPPRLRDINIDREPSALNQQHHHHHPPSR